MNARRAHTLLEILIAMAIVLAVSIVAWVGFGAWRARAGLESASNQVESAIQKCRDDAQSSGMPMRLVARSEPGGGIAIYIQPTEAGMSPRHLVTLPTSIRVSADRPVASVQSEEKPSSPEASAPNESFAANVSQDDRTSVGEEVTLISALPDGSVVTSGPSFLYDSREQELAVEISVDRWSGRVGFARPAVSANSNRDDARTSSARETPEGP